MGRGPRRGRAAAVLLAGLLITGCSGNRTPSPTATSARTASSTDVPPATASRGDQGPLVAATSESLPAAAYPAAVVLPWLDGVSGAPAIRVIDGDVVQWQGSTPGERAELLPNGSYRWAGPDGSMVGCGARPSTVDDRRRCIAIDRVGDTVVTGGGAGSRIAYGPTGRWLGNFVAGGAKAPGGRPEQTLPEAIAATGVDLPALVDFATRTVPFAGGTTGDPHLITVGGTRVTTQRPGDFDARTGDAEHRIQVRSEPMPYRPDVSYVTAVAIGTQSNRIELTRTGELLLDGVLQPGGEQFRQIQVPGGAVIGWWPPDAVGVVDAVVRWSDGSTVTTAADPALGLTVVANLPSGAVGGLFGSQQPGPHAAGTSGAATPTPDLPDAPSPNRRNDFVARMGAAGASTDDQVVTSWRVRAGDSLITGAAPVDRPPPPVQVATPSADLAAQRACAKAGLTSSDDLSACVQDVARTGDPGYVPHHAELSAAAAGPVMPGSLAEQFPGLVLGAPGTATPMTLGTAIDAELAPGQRRVFLVDLTGSDRLSIKSPDCARSLTGEHPAAGAAAVRVFDGWGAPVSDRLATCGGVVTASLSAGSYYVLLAGPLAGPAASFDVRVNGF